MVDGEQDPELERAAGELPPEPPPVSVPWREILAWIVSAFVIAWAVVLLPGIVRQLEGIQRESTAPSDASSARTLPPDPPLLPEVRSLMLLGQEAEDAGQLAKARAKYHQASMLQPKCGSCVLRLIVVERRIDEACVAALADGARYLSEARFEEAARSYQLVLNLVPDKAGNYHVLAADGLAKARDGAKKSGRPLP